MVPELVQSSTGICKAMLALRRYIVEDSRPGPRPGRAPDGTANTGSPDEPVPLCTRALSDHNSRRRRPL
jgi:hypothetical protein